MIDPLAAKSASYYTRKLAEFGPTPRGADWNSRESQNLRFAQLLRVCRPDEPLEINDYGCEYGALAQYLDQSGRPFEYCGYDAAEAMITAAQQTIGPDPRCRFTADRAEVRPRRFTVASGVFNVREEASDAAWWDYIVRTLDELTALSTIGFSCNFLTSHSDADRKRSDLYYADPSEILRFCLVRYPRRVAVVHDYPLYEFTLLVRV
jgi:hypothetical protein